MFGKTPDFETDYRTFYEPKRGIDGVWELPLVLETMSEAVDTAVPLPLHYQKLNADVLAYLEDAAQQLPKRAKARVVVYLPLEKLQPGLEEKLNKCLVVYSHARLLKLRREETKAKLNALKALFWGFVFMLACQVIRYFADFPNYPTLTKTLSEGLLVLGWVALWDPFEEMLFNWRPSVERRKLHERLAGFPLVLRPLPGTLQNMLETAKSI